MGLLCRLFKCTQLEAHYTLSEEECRFIRHHAHGDTGHLSLAILLKTRPPMGYFPALTEVPDQICGHLAQQLGVAEHTRLVDEVSRPATSHRYRTDLIAYFTDDGHLFHAKVAGDFSRRRRSSSGLGTSGRSAATRVG